MTAATFNYLEAGVWAVMAVVVALKAMFGEGMGAYRGVLFFLSFWLVLFGMSDLVEARTGAWWEPLGLLVFKAACVLGITFCFVRYYRIWKRKN